MIAIKGGIKLFGSDSEQSMVFNATCPCQCRQLDNNKQGKLTRLRYHILQTMDGLSPYDFFKFERDL